MLAKKAFTAEYTGTARLMSELYHIPPIYSVVSTGLLTMAYSSIVGVSVSLFTDAIQTILIATLLILCIATAQKFSFRMLETPENSHLGFTEAGLDSIFTVGIGTFSYYLFSDMCWQRLIATDNATSTRRSVIIGSILTLISISLVGLLSIISVATTDTQGSQELRLYYSVLSCDNCQTINMRALKMGVMILAIIINATSIDNCQACITATITSYILSFAPSLKERKKFSVASARIIQLLSNVLCICIAAVGLKIISFYLISTLIAASSCAPFIIGLNSTAGKYIDSNTVLGVFLFTTLTNILYYYIVEARGPLDTLQTYYFDVYRKETFLICVFLPYLYTGIACYAVYIYRRVRKIESIESRRKGSLVHTKGQRNRTPHVNSEEYLRSSEMNQHV